MKELKWKKEIESREELKISCCDGAEDAEPPHGGCDVERTTGDKEEV